MKNELLKIAKERYPSGTHFICEFDGDDKAVVSGDLYMGDDDDIYCMNGGFKMYVRENNKWAKIIKKTKPECKTLKPDEKIVKYALDLHGIKLDEMPEEEQIKTLESFWWLQKYVNGWQYKGKMIIREERSKARGKVRWFLMTMIVTVVVIVLNAIF